jgi:hypothetical protein
LRNLRSAISTTRSKRNLQLIENEHYRAFLSAVYDEQAIEGSLAADNAMAATMIREQAKAIGNVELANEKLATIAKGLGVVLRRYGVHRKQRRDMLGGKFIPADVFEVGESSED